MKTESIHTLRFAAGLGITVAALLPVRAAVTYQVVTQHGEALPGGGTFRGGAINGDSVPVLNGAGKVAFNGVADIAGGGSFRGVWSNAGGSMSLIARSETQAPGTTADFSRFYPPVLGGNAVLVRSDLAGSNGTGLWGGSGGTLHLLALSGAPAPGTSGRIFSNANWFPTLNVADMVAFTASTHLPGDPANPVTHVFTGSTSNLTPGATTPTAALVMLTDQGKLFLPFGSFDGATVVQMGQSMPGGGSLGRPGGVGPRTTCSGGGHVAVVCELSPSGAGVWRWTQNSAQPLELIARTGEPAPGAGAGLTFSDFREAAVSANGAVVFRGILTGTGVSAANDCGLWAGTPGSLRMVAREGQTAPGTAFTFREFDGTIPLLYRINSSGQIAMRAGIGTTFANRKGIWFDDGQGTQTLIAHTTNTLPDITGAQRTIFNLVTTVESRSGFFVEAGDTHDGRQNWFNDAGQIAFGASFTGNSDVGVIYVASAFSTPPPVPPEITGVAFAGASIQVTITSQSGFSYVLEKSFTMAAASWIDVVSTPGNGSALTLSDPGPGGPRSYFRVRVQPL